MFTKVTDYFDHTVMPTIREKHPEVYAQMSIMILGSVGLGIDDEFSDMEAAVYLDEPVWRAYGAQLQLTLNRCLAGTNRWREKGSIICVHPLSWLLDGQTKHFLDGKDPLPWEKVSSEVLFTMQENYIYYDPSGMLQRLRSRTAPQQYPEQLWEQKLLSAFQQLVSEDFSELKRCAVRGHVTEASIVMGPVLEGLLHTAFLMAHRYYPWRTHLRWAFERLPLASDFGPCLDEVLACGDWIEKARRIERMIGDYKDYMAARGLLPGVDIRSAGLDDELLWAQRLKAWENPGWRDRITALQKEAEGNGYPASDFWVWSLWPCIDRT